MEKIPKMHETVSGWARSLRKQMYGKPSEGSIEKSKRRHNAKQLAINKHKIHE